MYTIYLYVYYINYVLFIEYYMYIYNYIVVWRLTYEGNLAFILGWDGEAKWMVIDIYIYTYITQKNWTSYLSLC